MAEPDALTPEEPRRIVAAFLDELFSGLSVDPSFERRMREALPELPAEATADRREAAAELVRLVQDPDFRSRMRRMAERADALGRRGGQDAATTARGAEVVVERAGAATAQGIDPESREAAPIADEIARAFATPWQQPADPGFRSALAERLETFSDERAERYWQLLAIVNGWPPAPSSAPAFAWAIAALRARPRPLDAARP